MPIEYPTNLHFDQLEAPPATAPIASIVPQERNKYNEEASFNTPGAVSMPFEAPKGKDSLSTAHVGVQIPPPFANDYEEESSSSNQDESFVPDRPSDVNNEFTNTNRGPPLEIPKAPTIHQSNDSDKKDDDDENGNNFESNSLSDLEARFAKLKK